MPANWKLTSRFSGRESLEKAKAEGPRRKLVGFKVDAPEAMLWGGELILRDGAVAGQVTSAAWGETSGTCVGLAYVRASENAVIDGGWIKTGTYEVNVGGQLYPISVSLRPLYDRATNEFARSRSPGRGCLRHRADGGALDANLYSAISYM